MPSLINDAFMRLSKRAETNRSKLVATFVDVGPLFTLLSGKDHQVLYGRRGTGKTHALSYLAEIKQNEGNIAVYLDMRTIGSTGGLYADTSYPISQRATRLLVDTLQAIHDEMLTYFIENGEVYDLSQVGPILDQLADATRDVTVTGNIEREITSTENIDVSRTSKSEIGIGKEGVNLTLGGSSEDKDASSNSYKLKESGNVMHRVSFGAVGRIFGDISRIMSSKRVWIMLDEWSSIPLELQPYLADLLRRSAFPVPNFTIKIAAIEQRSRFRVPTPNRDYIGIELGADIAADLNLDDFMVFDNDADKATAFFQDLLFKHMREVDEIDVSQGPKTSQELIQQGFTQKSVFEELVRAAEGVPRDAINIINLAAQKALEGRISVANIRTAARNWYQRDKEAALRSTRDAYSLLQWIIDEVIGQRRARAFLLRNDSIPEPIEVLFDARVLHILKRNISAKDQPGTRYDSYKLDYGCYVDLITTTRAPVGNLPTENDAGDEEYMEVPSDDYRAIRRAILDINEFLNRPQS